MKLAYINAEDLLHIQLDTREVRDTFEVMPGVILQLDDQGHLVGVGVANASHMADLSVVEIEGIGEETSPS